MRRLIKTHLAELGTRQEAGSLSGVRPRPRTGSPVGAEPQRPLYYVDGSVHAALAIVPECTEPSTT